MLDRRNQHGYVWVGGRCPDCRHFVWVTVSWKKWFGSSLYKGREVRCRCGRVFKL